MIIIILFGFLELSFANGLPSHTAANPNGFWSKLPEGRNYLFCGDRIFYSSNFETKVKVDYDGSSRYASFKKHCSNRRIHIERVVKQEKTGDESLITSSYRTLSAKLKKALKNKKHLKYVNENGYSYKEMRWAFGEGGLTKLRVSNLLLPYLTKAEFDQIYAKSSNNPDYLKAEYARYSSNLLTQNPAMLYTADGKLYYFSFNLSDEQLRRLASLVGGAGGSSLGGGYGSNSPGGSGTAPGVNFDEEEGARLPASAVAPATAGLEAGFPGFGTESQALRVAPQPTRLPSSMGVKPSTTLNVPSKSQISRAAASSPASAPARPAYRPQAGTMNPDLSGLNKIGGQKRSGNRDLGGQSSNRKPASENPRSKLPSTSPAVSTPSTPELKEIKVEAQRMPPIDLLTRSLPPEPPPTPGPADPGDRDLPVPGNFASAIKCNEKQWPLLLEAQLHQDVSSRSGKFSCTTTTAQYCGIAKTSDSYDPSQCLERNHDSCSEVVNNDVDNICKKYFSYKRPKCRDTIRGERCRGEREIKDNEALTYKERFQCSQAMIGLACGKIPCEKMVTNDDVSILFYEEAVDEENFKKFEDAFKAYKKGEIGIYSVKSAKLLVDNNTKRLFDTSIVETEGLFGKEQAIKTTLRSKKSLLSTLNHIMGSSHNLIDRDSGKPINYNKLNFKQELPKTLLNDFKPEITKLNMFYEMNAREDICSSYRTLKGHGDAEN